MNSTQAPPPPSSPVPATTATMNFAVVPKHMFAVSEKVSDMIFSPDRPPQVELNGKLQAVAVPGLDMLTPAHTAGIAKLIIGNHHKSF